MKTLKLLSGHEMPIIGLGTWRSKPGEVTNAVKVALECGYKHIDCAHVYENEAEVGAGLKDCISRGVVKREEIFITSKLWITKLRPAVVREACEKTLSQLGCDYLDLYLIHWPFGLKEGDEIFPTDADGKWLTSDIDYLDAWKAMEDLVDAGLSRSIGISNFNRRQVQRVWDNCRIKPSVLQVEVNPYCNNLKLANFAKSLGMQVTAYSPLGNPDFCPPTQEKPGVLNDPVVTKIAARIGKSPAQVLIRYCIDRGIIVIPKSVTPHRIAENLKVLEFSLTKEDVEDLNNIPTKHRVCHFDIMAHHPAYPFHDEY